jgi:hypothetical protein
MRSTLSKPRMKSSTRLNLKLNSNVKKKILVDRRDKARVKNEHRSSLIILFKKN